MKNSSPFVGCFFLGLAMANQSLDNLFDATGCHFELVVRCYPTPDKDALDEWREEVGIHLVRFVWPNDERYNDGDDDGD